MFIDTNVLVYARFREAPHHAVARFHLASAVNGRERVSISWQVIREYLAVVTRVQGWSVPLSMTEALKDAALFTSIFHVLESGASVMAKLELLARSVSFTGRQVHDANIVATMIAHTETRLLTFNLKDFHRYDAHIELIDLISGKTAS